MAKKKPDKLSQEVAQALAAGMSYGKWKALQEPVKIVKEEEIPEGWSKCQYCGKVFKPTIKRPQKFCDSVCREKSYFPKRRIIQAEYMRGYKARKKAELRCKVDGDGNG